MANGMFSSYELVDCKGEKCSLPFMRSIGSKRDNCGVCRAIARREKAFKDAAIAETQLAEAKQGQEALVAYLSAKGLFKAPDKEPILLGPGEPEGEDDGFRIEAQ